MTNQDIIFMFACLILSIMSGGVIFVFGAAVYEYLMEMNGE